MRRFKEFLALIGASSLLFGADAFAAETRTAESEKRTVSSLVENERTMRSRSYRGQAHFTTMPAATYPAVAWERVNTVPSVRTYYIPTQALAINVPLKPGAHNGHGLQFAIPVATTSPTLLRVMARFDFDGNGRTDRMETYYATVADGVVVLTHTAGVEDNRSYGQFPNLIAPGASVTLLLWIPEGMEPVTIMTGQAFVKAPFGDNAEVCLSQADSTDTATVVPASTGLASLAIKGSGKGMFATAVKHPGVSTPWLDQSGKKPPEADFSMTL